MIIPVIIHFMLNTPKKTQNIKQWNIEKFSNYYSQLLSTRKFKCF